MYYTKVTHCDNFIPRSHPARTTLSRHEINCHQINFYEINSRQDDLMRVDLVAIDLVRIDPVAIDLVAIDLVRIDLGMCKQILKANCTGVGFRSGNRDYLCTGHISANTPIPAGVQWTQTFRVKSRLHGSKVTFQMDTGG